VLVVGLLTVASDGGTGGAWYPSAITPPTSNASGWTPTGTPWNEYVTTPVAACVVSMSAVQVACGAPPPSTPRVQSSSSRSASGVVARVVVSSLVTSICGTG